jgi:predicted nucleotidyltransferase component of viral defense system
MPNVSQMLRSLAKAHGVALEILQKDYALSYLLAGIAQTPRLGERIALKGGTALKKVYYADYRFSEDLDYSTLKLGLLPDSRVLMEIAVGHMTDLLNERGPFDVQLEPLTLRQPHPGGQIAYTVRVRFPDQRQALCRLKVEITVDEPVFLPTEQRSILHVYAEPFTETVRAYSLKEIVAEKLRALLQSQAKLNSRGWGSSRICRDYYDLWYILSRENFTGLPSLFAKKCKVRLVALDSPEDFMNADLVGLAQREWDQQLSPFVQDAPTAGQVLAEVKPLILNVFG